MASPALRTAWFKPRICCVILVAMAIPAASSLAELMRLPVDNCCIAKLCALPEFVSAFCENNALTLVLITAIFFS